MTPESQDHLDKAREYLTKAREILDRLHYNDEAGRAAYLAGFQAAQALISERTGRVAKTHEGVNSQFNLLELRNYGDSALNSIFRRNLEAFPRVKCTVTGISLSPS